MVLLLLIIFLSITLLVFTQTVVGMFLLFFYLKVQPLAGTISLVELIICISFLKTYLLNHDFKKVKSCQEHKRKE